MRRQVKKTANAVPVFFGLYRMVKIKFSGVTLYRKRRVLGTDIQKAKKTKLETKSRFSYQVFKDKRKDVE